MGYSVVDTADTNTLPDAYYSLPRHNIDKCDIDELHLRLCDHGQRLESIYKDIKGIQSAVKPKMQAPFPKALPADDVEIHYNCNDDIRSSMDRRRLPAALDSQVSNGLAHSSAEVLPWLPTAGVLMVLAFLVYQFVVRRLAKSKLNARDSVRILKLDCSGMTP